MRAIQQAETISAALWETNGAITLRLESVNWSTSPSSRSWNNSHSQDDYFSFRDASTSISTRLPQLTANPWIFPADLRTPVQHDP